MDFLNQQIEISSLPDAGNVNWNKIERSYLKVLRLQWLLVTLILLGLSTLILLFSRPLQTSVGIALVTGIGLVLSLVYLTYIEQSFHYRAYAVREHDIIYRHGWIIRSIDACPFNRIQHCSVNAGPLERKYKLSSLTLYTAASGEGDLKISGLPESRAVEIREFVMKKIAPYEGPGN